jgi:hypothetical protein
MGQGRWAVETRDGGNAGARRRCWGRYTVGAASAGGTLCVVVGGRVTSWRGTRSRVPGAFCRSMSIADVTGY